MDPVIAKKEELERLHGLLFDEKTLTIRVRSTGCTNKEDFEISVSKAGPGKAALTLEIVRIEPDFCRTTPHPVDITFSWEELGVDPGLLKTASVKVANPFGVLR